MFKLAVISLATRSCPRRRGLKLSSKVPGLQETASLFSLTRRPAALPSSATSLWQGRCNGGRLELVLRSRRKIVSGGTLSLTSLSPCRIPGARHRSRQAPHWLPGEVAAEAPCVGESLTPDVGGRGLGGGEGGCDVELGTIVCAVGYVWPG
jgi:hypothetical protein